ncbi:Aste57867_357 [Aphanomyces stellatus]|uniref:Aste57867_357 protein n=1 Tax=Aphanomyces stellatus TaxID=120398 RepID=A0A485K6J7_9STRA|nr:hypothetical protein As57867_000356 [Aphanomyces stellatus]VFT77583.1 Aste57867_357 [Aphanomyces stellatus]
MIAEEQVRDGKIAREEKQERERKRHFLYRIEKKSEAAHLKQTQIELETKLQQLVEASKLRQPHILSWRDAAKALKDARDGAHVRNRQLRARIHIYERLVRDLSMWVQATDGVSVPFSFLPMIISLTPQYICQRSLNPLSPTWRDVTLLANPESRKLGKEWITMQMFHNTDRVFQQHGFPSWDCDDVDVYRDLDISFPESGGCLYTSRRHFVSSKSLEQSCDAVRRNCLSTLLVHVNRVETLREADANTQLLTVHTTNDEFLNILCGEFATPDRCTFVLRQIQRDDTQEGRFRQRNRMLWYDFFRLPNGCSKKRSLAIASNCFVRDDEFSLDDEACTLGFHLDDAPPARKEDIFRSRLLGALDKLLERLDTNVGLIRTSSG